jgi:hypothetical protein
VCFIELMLPVDSIDFGEFLMVIKEQKAATAAAGDEGDTILAFVALGGQPDKGGVISAERLRATCKVSEPSRGAACWAGRTARCVRCPTHPPAYLAVLPANPSIAGSDLVWRAVWPPQEFGLTIDIDSLIKQYDADGSGEIGA